MVTSILFQSENKSAIAKRSRWRISRLFWPDHRDVVTLGLLRLVNQSILHRLPLDMIVAEYASEHRWLTRWRLLRLSRLLGTGKSLPDALEQVPGLVSDADGLEIRCLHQSGLLAAGIPRLIEEHSGRSYQAHHNRTKAVAYTVGMSLAVAVISLFLFYFIEPTLQTISQEFNETPGLLSWMARYAQLATKVFFMVLCLAIFLIPVLFFSKIAIRIKRVLGSRISINVARRQTASLMKLLAQSIRHGRTIQSTISTLARYHYDPATRGKLLLARNEMEFESDNWACLQRADLLPAPLILSIQNVETSDFKAWILEKSANQIVQKSDQTKLVRSTLVHPVIVLFFGAIVMLICVAFFGSVVSFVNLSA